MSADVVTYASHKKQIETVVIDDTSEQNTNPSNNADVVELPSDDDDDVAIVHQHPNTDLFETILDSKTLLADVIEKFLEIENTAAMERVLKSTLLTFYKQANKSYLKSPEFDKALVRTLTNLEQQPHLKYTHIKCLCEKLRLSHNWKARKKATLTTLTTNVSEKYKKKKGRLRTNRDLVDNNKKDTLENVIELEDQELEASEVINVDDYQSDVIILDEREKENIESETSKACIDVLAVSQTNTLLVPHKSAESTEEQRQALIALKEERIKTLHEMITMLEEVEVTDDSEGSPYIICENYKKELVSHYKELCKLTGSKEKKRKKIHLNVLDGHPPGPTKMLESFINNGEDFIFPNLVDVVTCVEQGLIKDGLNWNRTEILKTASTLFLQCGRALQKYRKRREWKDMLYHIKEEPVWDEIDPADRDPELMAKLELNKQLAIDKEREIIDKYAQLQDFSPAGASTNLSTGDLMEIDCEDMEDSDEESSEIAATSNIAPHNTNNLDCVTDAPNTSNCTNQSQTVNNQTDSSNNETPIAVVKPFVIDTHLDSRGFLVVCIDAKDKEQKANGVTNYEELYKSTEKNIINSENKTSGNTDDEEHIDTKNDRTIIEQSVIDEKNKDGEQVTVKIEPTENLVNLLESLGDNYTVSIVDIEDPFLVVEISSDSDTDNDSESDECVCLA